MNTTQSWTMEKNMTQNPTPGAPYPQCYRYTQLILRPYFFEFSGVTMVALLQVDQPLRIIFAVEFLSLFLILKWFENVYLLYLNLLLFDDHTNHVFAAMVHECRIFTDLFI